MEGGLFVINRVAEWISSRSYVIDGRSIAYLVDEKQHVSLLLKDDWASVWSFILSGTEINDIMSFCSKNGIDEDLLEQFICVLRKYGILHSFSQPFISSIDKTYQAINNSAQEFRIFQKEMSDWFVQNNLMQSLFIELTNNCNEACLHCSNVRGTKEITFLEAKKIIDEAFSLGVLFVTLSGGECTLNKDFIKIAKYVRQKRLALKIFTNGQTLYDDEELFNEIIKIYPHQISLSLYSLNAEIHDKITGVVGSQQKTLYIIEKLLKNNVSVEIKCFLSSLNADSFIDVQNFAENVGASIALDCTFINNPNRNNKYMEVTDQQLFKIYSDQKSLLTAKRDFPEIDEKFLDSTVCRIGKNGLSIGPDLNIYACIISEILLGNAKKDSLAEIWKSKKLQEIKQIKNKDRLRCFKHDYCKFCNYCLGIPQINNRPLQDYDLFCRQAKIKMKAQKESI